jgi:hypothetical protein
MTTAYRAVLVTGASRSAAMTGARTAALGQPRWRVATKLGSFAFFVAGGVRLAIVGRGESRLREASKNKEGTRYVVE